MKHVGLFLLLFVIIMATSLSSCSPVSRSSRAIVVDDGGSMRYMNGRPDKVHKKWKSNTYKPKKSRKKRSKGW